MVLSGFVRLWFGLLLYACCRVDVVATIVVAARDAMLSWSCTAAIVVAYIPCMRYMLYQAVLSFDICWPCVLLPLPLALSYCPPCPALMLLLEIFAWLMFVPVPCLGCPADVRTVAGICDLLGLLHHRIRLRSLGSRFLLLARLPAVHWVLVQVVVVVLRASRVDVFLGCGPNALYTSCV